MTKRWPKVINDCIHNLIPFEDNPTDKLLLRLVDTPEFQRLRRIKQLGMSHLVFPGADHSRLSHSLGVLFIARKFVERIMQHIHVDEEARKVLLAAALLHDLGHGPFSHAFEKVTGERHERRTQEIILDPSTGVHRVLSEESKDLPKKVALFFTDGTTDADFENMGIPPVFQQVISSQMDADRADYLLRDSYQTGTSYGVFDLEWLLAQLLVDPEGKRLYLSRKGKAVAEQYIYARHHMYASVYFHKATRSAEIMLRLVLQRAKELLKQEDKEGVPAEPKVLIQALSQEQISLGQYLELDDPSIIYFLKQARSSRDTILSYLAKGLVNRHLYKSIDITGLKLSASLHTFLYTAHDFVRDRGYDVRYFFVNDSPSDTPYKPYIPDAEHPPSQILVEGVTGDIQEITAHSDGLKHLTKEVVFTRYHFPEFLRENIRKIQKDTIGGI